MRTNFISVVNFTNNCIENNIINSNGIILNVGSLYGTLRGIKDNEIKNKIFNA